ncbi:MAG: triose-phosphate isomerase [Candidatus Nitrosothermus koennekii]|nr:MAG: triose-phosphate isomerase [Candidatus Nitrosothermus koennekii]
MNQSNLLIINYKNYEEIAGEKGLELAKIAEKVAEELNKEIIIAPTQCSLAYIANNVKIKVFAQHLDNAMVGSTTGFVVPEIIKGCNVKGSLINHSEHRISNNEIESLINRLKSLGMISIICAQTPDEVKELAVLEPDYIAIEPPELIGSGIAVSKAKPEVITDSIKVANNVKVICGAGIVDGSDVEAAIKLGSKGVLVASGIVKADDWYEKVYELASNL